MSDEESLTIAQMRGSNEEKADLKKRAEAENLSVSNFLRKLAGYPLLQTYAPKGNKRALGNSGRWRKGGKVAAKVKQYE